MLTIRKEQSDKLGEVIEKSFKKNTIIRLKEKYPQETIGKNDDEMMEFIHSGIEKAEKHNIIERRDISVYLEYMLVYGEDFDFNSDNKWAMKVFRVKNLSGKEKVRRLLKSNPI